MKRNLLLAIKIILYFTVMTLAYAVNTTICPAMAIRGVTPDILPYVLAFVVLHEEFRGGVAFGLVMGIMCDSMKSRYIGLFSLIYLYLAAGGGWLSENYLKKNLFSGVLAGSVFFTAMSVTRFMFVYFLGFQEDVAPMALVVFFSLFYSCVVSIPFYGLVRLISRLRPVDEAEA